MSDNRDRPIFGADAFKDLSALKPDTPQPDGVEAEVGFVATEEDQGVKGEVTMPVGKSGAFAAAGEWMRKNGWSVFGGFTFGKRKGQ
jgi:hypothetical protein